VEYKVAETREYVSIKLNLREVKYKIKHLNLVCFKLFNFCDIFVNYFYNIIAFNKLKITYTLYVF